MNTYIISWYHLLCDSTGKLITINSVPLWQPTWASLQRFNLVLLKLQLSHCGFCHIAPLSYVPPQRRVPCKSWISWSSTPHGQVTVAMLPISVSGHITGATLPQSEAGCSGQPSWWEKHRVDKEKFYTMHHIWYYKERWPKTAIAGYASNIQ